MTDNNHPMLPTQEQLTEWDSERFDEGENFDVMMIKAFQAGADQELEACCEEMKSIPSPLGIPFGEMASNALRNARRPKPKPPSLKDQALKQLSGIETCFRASYGGDLITDTIRRALESLPDNQ